MKLNFKVSDMCAIEIGGRYYDLHNRGASVLRLTIEPNTNSILMHIWVPAGWRQPQNSVIRLLYIDVNSIAVSLWAHEDLIDVLCLIEKVGADGAIFDDALAGALRIELDSGGRIDVGAAACEASTVDGVDEIRDAIELLGLNPRT